MPRYALLTMADDTVWLRLKDLDCHAEYVRITGMDGDTIAAAAAFIVPRSRTTTCKGDCRYKLKRAVAA